MTMDTMPAYAEVAFSVCACGYAVQNTLFANHMW